MDSIYAHMYKVKILIEITKVASYFKGSGKMGL